MTTYTLEQINENQKNIATPKAKVQVQTQVKTQLSNVIMFDDQGKRVYPNQIKEVVEEVKTQVTNVKAQFTNKDGNVVTTKVQDYNENDLI